MKYYLYMYLDEHDEILYVGKTNNMQRRYAEHYRDDMYGREKCIYAVVYHAFIMNTIEQYLIAKYKPCYNDVGVENEIGNMVINVEEVCKWQTYHERINDREPVNYEPDAYELWLKEQENKQDDKDAWFYLQADGDKK